MDNNNQLLKEILLQIKKNPEIKDKTINVNGFDYDEKVFPILLELYKDGFIIAEPQKDETNEIIQLYVHKLTDKGEILLKNYTN